MKPWILLGFIFLTTDGNCYTDNIPIVKKEKEFKSEVKEKSVIVDGKAWKSKKDQDVLNKISKQSKETQEPKLAFCDREGQKKPLWARLKDKEESKRDVIESSLPSQMKQTEKKLENSGRIIN